MTIKKRLFLSNILMIVIPYVVSATTVLSTLLVFNHLTEYEYGGHFFGRRILLAFENERGIQAIFIAVLVMFFIVSIMIITNRFLTKFVIKRIEEPLKMLSDGVGHISGGNLDYQITYAEKDEFKPVCDAFNDMATQLKVSLETVQKNEQNRKELFTSISHDLRSPLTSIKAYVEGLIDGVANTPESQKEYLLTIKQKTDDINNMVSQLFSYSKMDMGSYPIKPEILDIGKEINDFVSASSDDYKVKGLSLEITGITSKIYIYADPLYLRSIFANILDNSAKYKVKESVNATVCCMLENDEITIIFNDDGPGVSKEALPKLFDVFYRADPSRNNPNQGSGLGLAIVSKALERMDGSVSAENIQSGGLQVVVKIPKMKGELPI